MDIKKKFQIFISSTYEDLREERRAAIEAILKLGHIPAGMEFFTAGNESQMEISKDWINESDIYMLILGPRYGSIEPITGLSYIECEYNYATLSKPFFSIVCSDDILSKTRESRNRKYITFREKVMSKTCLSYNDCKDIQSHIYLSIPDIINKNNNLIGWLPAVTSQETYKLASSIGKLDESEMPVKIELETIAKYLDQRYRTILRPDQPPYQRDYADRFHWLLDELKEAGYSTIGQLDEALVKSEAAFLQWEKDNVKHNEEEEGTSGPPDQIGIVTISLQIYDCNFYRAREGHKHETEAEWRDAYKRYHPLIKGGPIPCHSK